MDETDAETIEVSMACLTYDDVTKHCSEFIDNNGKKYKIWLTKDEKNVFVAVTPSDSEEDVKIVGTFRDADDGSYEFVLNNDPKY